MCPAPRGLLGLQALIRPLLGRPDPLEMREATAQLDLPALRLPLPGLPDLLGRRALPLR